MTGQQRPDRERLRTWRGFLHAHSRLMAELERELRSATGLSLAQYDVLLRLSEAPQQQLRMSELSTAVLYTTGGVTRLIDRMAEAGWVAREPSPTDRRSVLATLTPAGRDLLKRAGKIHLAGIQTHFAALLPDDELAPVSRFLARLAGTTEPQSGCVPGPGASQTRSE